jgi:hypothetical protein
MKISQSTAQHFVVIVVYCLLISLAFGISSLLNTPTEPTQKEQWYAFCPSVTASALLLTKSDLHFAMANK